MKVDPINLILENRLKIDTSFYFVSGNEVTLMQKIKDLLIKNLKSAKSVSLEKIKNISLIQNNGGLFADIKLYLIEEASGIDIETLDDLSKSDNKYIFFSENSPKLKKLKNIFLKRKDSVLFDCYELSRDVKSKVVKKFIDDNGLNIEQSLFWIIVDKLDNKYLFLENELKKLLYLDEKNINQTHLGIMVGNNYNDTEKIFFDVLKSNSSIINSYNNKITNDTEVNKLYYIVKQFSLLILSFNNTNDFEKNIPKYLFRERGFLIDLYKKYNNNKKKSLINLLYSTEKDIRSNGGLSLIIGMRFLLKFKKISIS